MQAAAAPGAVAVADGAAELSYAELDERSSRLARYLIGLGAGPEAVVAIAMERSALMVTALLGVLKAGAAYLPVDAGYPAERVRFMLADTGPLLVLTDAATAGGLPAAGVPCVVLDDPAVAARVAALPGTAPGDGDRAVPLRPAHPAYVIYTSGSTGTPKGVTVTARRDREPGSGAGTDAFGLVAGPGCRSSTSFSFDVSVLEMFVAVAGGRAALVVMPRAGSRWSGWPGSARCSAECGIAPVGWRLLSGAGRCGTRRCRGWQRWSLAGRPCPGQLA